MSSQETKVCICKKKTLFKVCFKKSQFGLKYYILQSYQIALVIDVS